jgi:signal transduction histidine kinase/CheY-like chemotaxis protein
MFGAPRPLDARAPLTPSDDRRMQLISVIDFFVPRATRDDLQTAQLTRLLVVACLVDGTLEPAMSLRHFLAGNLVGGWVTLGTGIFGLGLLGAIRTGLDPSITFDIIGTVVLGASTVVSLTRGGFYLSTVLGVPFVPLIAALSGRRRAALTWAALGAGVLGVLALASALGVGGLEPRTAIDAGPLFIVFVGTTTISIVHLSTRARLERENESLQRRIALNERLEALGHLAAGVAHDFNNLLSVFRASGEVMVEELPADHALRGDAEAICDAAERGASIASQLLAFSRPQTDDASAFDLVAKLTAMEPILRRALPETIALELLGSPRRLAVHGDARQLMNAVLNLVVNARDAMPKGGRVRISTEERLVEPSPGPGALAAGRYAAIEVHDDGSGIPPHVLPHIFEPFFTTKTRERGSGLGLATAFAVVRAMKGELRVRETEADRGSTFEILLPLLDEHEFESIVTTGPEPVSSRPRRKVLLVDDQPALVAAARRLLQRDFDVLAATSAAQALAAFEAQPNVDVVLTDVCMPDVGGIELAAELRRRKPRIGIVYMTGYSDDEAISKEVDAGTARLVRKPFERAGLTHALEQACGPGAAKVGGTRAV